MFLCRQNIMTEQWNNLQYCITTTNEKKYTTYFFLSILEHRELFSPIDYQLISIRQVPPNFLRQISPTISTILLAFNLSEYFSTSLWIPRISSSFACALLLIFKVSFRCSLLYCSIFSILFSTHLIAVEKLIYSFSIFLSCVLMLSRITFILFTISFNLSLRLLSSSLYSSSVIFPSWSLCLICEILFASLLIGSKNTVSRMS